MFLAQKPVSLARLLAALLPAAALAAALVGPTGIAPNAAGSAALTAALVSLLTVALVLLLGNRASHRGEERTFALRSVAARIEQEIAAAINDIKGLTDGMTDDADRLLEVAQNTTTNAASAVAAATEAMANAESVSSASEQMHASISEIAQQAVRSRTIACRAVELANQTKTAVTALKTATDTVEAIVSIIHGIAARTDLLALNAAVEAARAGAAGKGFAVVAGEVKRLANQAQDATVDIAERIGDMRKVVVQVGTAIDGVAEVIREVELTAGTISASVEQQSAATSEIARAVAEVSLASSGVATLMDGLAVEAVQAQELAEEVRLDSHRMTDSVGGLSRALLRVVRTAHRDVERRHHARHATFLPAVATFGGSEREITIIDVGIDGCSMDCADCDQVRTGQQVQVQCRDFGRARTGTIVSAEGAVAHVRFSAGDALEPALAAELASAGSRIIVKKAKADHRTFVQSIRQVLDGTSALKAADLSNHHTCRLGRWYDRVSDTRILGNTAFKALIEPHTRVHQAGKETLALSQTGDHHGAERAFHRMQGASQEVIVLLNQLARDLASH